MDNALFVRSKDPVLVEYQRAKKKMSDTVAGRGFSFEPGFMYDAQNDLEIDVKLKISEINYELLKAAIEQDIKQAGLDYDLAFRNARIAWESDKQALLYAWDQELIGIKQARAHEDHLLDLMAVEVSKRANLLLEAKTAIELEAEALRLQIAELDGSTGEYELQLANAKLLTANKKLEVIPILQQILGLEEEIVEKGREMISKGLILIEKDTEIVDIETMILGKNQELAANQADVITAERQLLKTEENLINDLKNKADDEKTYLEAATSTAEDIVDLIQPELEALIDKLAEYVEELTVQQELYDQIAVKKAETADVKIAIADKIKERDGVLDLKRDIAEAMTQLNDMAQALLEYKESEYAPVLSELIEAYDNYAQDILTGNGFKLLIAQAQAGVKRIELQRVGKEALVAEAEISKEEQISALNAAKLTNRTSEATNRVTVANQKVTDITARVTAEDQARADIVLAEDTSFGVMKAKKEVYQTTKINAELVDATSLETARQKEDVTRTNNYINKEKSITDIKINTDVTARLMHLLSQD